MGVSVADEDRGNVVSQIHARLAMPWNTIPRKKAVYSWFMLHSSVLDFSQIR